MQRPLRLTPPQLTVLRLLQDGWTLTTVAQPREFHKLLAYGFHHGEADTRWVSGTTLRSLEHRGLIAWEPATLTLVYDGSTVPGYQLMLTPAGEAVRTGTVPALEAGQ